MNQRTQGLLDESIRRLSGEAAEDPSPRAATTAEQDGGGGTSVPASLPAVDRNVWGETVEVPPLAERIDVGWIVWLGDPEGDMEHRKHGVVVDMESDDTVVVARDRARQRRQETWFEVWPIAGLDPTNCYDPGSSKRAQAAKKILMSIGETLNAGGWSEENERCFAAAGVLTAELARAWRS